MPGIEELMALRGGGGGGAPQGMPPQGMPPQGGGGMGGGAGGALIQKLQELMNDPVAMKGMMAYAQQMGLDPSMLMGGGGAAQGGPPPGPMDAPPPMAMEGAPGGDPEAMAAQEIDSAGATWDGVDAPTQNDIERLQAEPTDTNIDSFNEHFGEGMAEKYLGEGGEGGEAEAEGEEAPPEGEEGEY